MPDPVNVQDFNVYQNIVMVEDRDRDGTVSSSDSAIAKQDVTLKGVLFKRGDEIPFNDYKFLMNGFDAKSASRWRQAGDSRIPYEVGDRHGVRLEKENGIRSPRDFYRVVDAQSGAFLGTVHANAGDSMSLDASVAALKATSKGQKPAPGLGQVSISREAEETFRKAGVKIQYEGDEIIFRHPKTTIKYVNDGREEQVFFRRAGTDKNPQVVMVALRKDGTVKTTKVWPWPQP